MSAGKTTRTAPPNVATGAGPSTSSGRPGARTLTVPPLPRAPRELGLPEPARPADPHSAPQEARPELSPEARAALERDADVHIDAVVDYYGHACSDVAYALHERAKSRSSGNWFLELIVDVLAGTLLPGLAKSALRRAVDALTASAKWEETIELGLFVLESKQVDALVGRAVGAINGGMKSAFKQIAPDRSATEEFVRDLRDAAIGRMTQLRKSLGALDDDELMAVCLAYHPDQNSSRAFADRITELALRFEAQVEPIGDRSSEGAGMAYLHSRDKTLALIVTDDGDEKLALVTRSSLTLRATGEQQGDARYRLEEWITDDMKPLALARMGTTPIPRLRANEVWAKGSPDRPTVRVR